MGTPLALAKYGYRLVLCSQKTANPVDCRREPPQTQAVGSTLEEGEGVGEIRSDSSFANATSLQKSNDEAKNTRQPQEVVNERGREWSLEPHSLRTRSSTTQRPSTEHAPEDTRQPQEVVDERGREWSLEPHSLRTRSSTTQRPSIERAPIGTEIPRRTTVPADVNGTWPLTGITTSRWHKGHRLSKGR